jgi:nitroreductase/dihydropteridine reductase
MNYIENFEWRYATKRMNGQKVPAEKLDNILKAIQLAPTSLGLQPIKILVVESPGGKAMLAKACNQPQVMESSAMLIFCYWDSITDEKIDNYLKNISETRNQEIASLTDFRKMITGFSGSMSVEAQNIWAARQAYIALGFGLVAAALEKVDATPMEGFNTQIADKVFGLNEKGLKSVVLMAVGYRDEAKDYLVKAKKVRRSISELFERV